MSGTFFILFFNISFPLANLCGSSLSLNSLLLGSLCPVALWSLGLQCLQISLYLSYWHVCPICPCWSRSSWQMGPGCCGKSQALEKCWKTAILCLFPSVVPPRLLAALLSPKIYRNYLTKPLFLQAPSPVCDCHNQPCWGHDTGNGCTGNAGVAIPGVALEPCLCRKVL